MNYGVFNFRMDAEQIAIGSDHSSLGDEKMHANLWFDPWQNKQD